MIPSNGRPRLARRAAAGTVAALLSAGVLAGCGGSSSKASGDASTTVPSAGGPSLAESLPADLPQKAACAMATVAEVEAAIGAEVSAGKEEVQGSRSLCTFAVVSKPSESVVLVSTTSSGVPAFVTSAQQRAAAAQPVSAGEQAFVSGAQGLVRRGNTMVAVLVVLRQPPAQLTSAATKLVQAVGTHL